MSEQSSVWIFQANPKRYQIFESLASQAEEYWNLNQHMKDVRVGDRVLIWVSGEAAGIYAIGTILTPPVAMSDSPQGMSYWIDKESGWRRKARVRVRYDTVLLDHPLTKAYIWTDPALWRLRILSFPRGTNFPVSAEEWQALQDWLGRESQ